MIWWVGPPLLMTALWALATMPSELSDLLPVYGIAAFACILHLYVHEFGHLLSSRAARFPIAEFSVLARRRQRGFRVGAVMVRLGLFGRVCHVRLASNPIRRGPLIAMFLAGPTANLLLSGLAWVAYRNIPDPSPWLGWALVATVIAGLVVGLTNLLPGAKGAQRTDGLRVLDTLRRPGIAAQMAHMVAGEARIRSKAGLAKLRTTVDAGGPPAMAAATSLLATSVKFKQLPVDTPRLLNLARDPSTNPILAGTVAACIAELQVIQLFDNVSRAMTKSGETFKEIDPALAQPILEVAELAYARAPERLETRVSLGMALVLVNRSADVGSLFAGFLVDKAGRETDPRPRANGLAVLAAAAVDLGNLREARRLVDAAFATRPTILNAIIRLTVEGYEQRAALRGPLVHR